MSVCVVSETNEGKVLVKSKQDWTTDVAQQSSLRCQGVVTGELGLKSLTVHVRGGVCQGVVKFGLESLTVRVFFWSRIGQSYRSKLFNGACVFCQGVVKIRPEVFNSAWGFF